MKVRIESDRHGYAKVFLNEQETRAVRSLTLNMSVGEVHTLTLEHVSNAVEFEGEAQVIALIDGRRYRLIEDDQTAQGRCLECRQAFTTPYEVHNHRCGDPGEGQKF